MGETLSTSIIRPSQADAGVDIQSKNGIMFKNYLKIAWRNVIKNKGYAAINIGGLAIGLACCLMITLYVKNEYSFDRYHEKGDHIYRVVHHRNSDDLADSWIWGNAPVGKALKEDFPEVIEKVQFSGRSDILLKHGENAFQEGDTFYADPSVFSVFSWPLVSGDTATALEVPYSIVLTETAAKKYFGNEDPLGKSIEGTGGRANDGTYTVTGIMKDIPANSHFRFDVLMSMSSFEQTRPGVFDAWGYVDFYTYFLVADNFDPIAFQEKVPAFLDRHIDPADREAYYYDISFESLNEVYLQSKAARQPGVTGSLTNIYIFILIGIFILIVASINFMNLATARSLERAKEVGIRKVIGADRKRLIYQFLGESLILVLIASILGLLIAFYTLPWIGDITGKNLVRADLVKPSILFLFLGMAAVTGLISGSYPAFVLSSFKPARVLKGVFKTSHHGANLRKGLVVFQFSLSIALIASTVLVYHQLDFMKSKDLGFDREQQMILDFNWDGYVLGNVERIKKDFLDHPDVTSVSVSRTVPGTHFPAAGTEIETYEGPMEHFEPFIFEVDANFITHFDMKLVAGRSFSPDFPADSISSLVINEAAARDFGYSDPEAILGKKFEQWGRTGTIIGVVEDFNYLSLHQQVAPLTIRQVPYGRYISLKLNSNDYQRTISEIERKWKEIIPHRPFLFGFLDESFNEQYAADTRFTQLFTLFSFLAIFIACLGLLGLATNSAMQRTREIGIRKVLGAKVSSIITLLSTDFLKLVFTAIIIAIPFSWFAMTKWLEDFAYSVEIKWWVFGIAGVIAIVIATLTISFHAIKAAVANPVNSLRRE